MKQKVLSLLLVVIMVASAFTAVELTAGTTTVAAHTATKTWLTVSTQSPQINQKVTFTATLKRWSASANAYVALSGKYVRIGHYSSTGVWITDYTQLTNAYGKITWVKSWPSAGGQYYYARFFTDSTYAGSLSTKVLVNVLLISTRVTISPSVTRTSVGKPVQFTVTLKSWNPATKAYDLPVSKNVRIYHDTRFLDSGQFLRFTDPMVRTDASGKAVFTLTMGTEPTERVYHAAFDGTSLYERHASYAPLITAKWSTSIYFNINTESSTKHVLFGYLKDQNNHMLGGKRINIFHRVYTSPTTYSWEFFTYVYTSSSSSSLGIFKYTSGVSYKAHYIAVFPGDNLFWPSEGQDVYG